MQRLYVVGFNTELTTADSAETAFDRLADHMALHLESRVTGLRRADLIARAGETVIKSRRPEWADNHLSWRPVIVNDRTRALRLTIEHDLQTGGRFVCELTAADHASETSFRVVLGRRSDGRLTPARVDDLKPPRALRAVMADSALSCTDGSDHVTAAVTNVLTAQVRGICDWLTDLQRRLPVLVISAMRPSGASATLAHSAADQLTGLAHVVVISGWLALDAFNQGRSDHDRLVRDAGRLYWPDMDARHPWWDATALHGNHEELLARLTRMITPFSVVARGRDQLWDAVRAADDAAALDDLAETEAARANRFKALLDDERAQNLELLEENVRLEQQIRSLQVEIENRDAQQAYAASASVAPESGTPAPTRDFTEQWERWEARSEGALVFTERAKSSWADCVYEDFEGMWGALDALVGLAREWRSVDGNVGQRLEDWIRERTALKYAHSDEGLRRAGLDTFTFDERSLDRTPHIKLDDHTKPNKVGRIYFALDNVGRQWVVDHVGLKLHGV
ncbi:hypothetical protein LO763_19665 [Glycomyces sp. A-F 0318]|uniref:hypothetical protein n=1 Tax=Glycomyces amatae TaxID=2881355 RepID=UPI001E4A4189|nr:hypothetical protein [Glycomyces amatae]MCD0445830.1 hypothetical protein [Glycomyces amatae]